MFDFAWSEIGVIAVVALIFIGPKDMPVAIKAVKGAINKARRMASEFQTHVDEMVREADLQEVRDSIGGIAGLRKFGVAGALTKLIDDDGTIRRSLADPLTSTSLSSPPAPQTEPVPLDQAFVVTAERPEAEAAPDAATVASIEESVPEAVAEPEGAERLIEVPAFIPPRITLVKRPAAHAPKPPPFIPPRAAPPPSLRA
ncbi:MAG TPA: Sec-independent protein translocase protein TatB [Acetobacteraceae bacterium]|nr:Sec-independent protein translocase protein TatB [Acetobacteraceae bacterium]